MDRGPSKVRIGSRAREDYRSPTRGDSAYPTVHEERERGEITESERSRDRDFRELDRHRERERERYPRDDTYSSARPSYEHDARRWDRGRSRERERDFDRRDDREWTRDTGRARNYRDGRGTWRDDRERDRDMDRDRDRDRYYERDRGRESKGVYERPREREDRVRDRRREVDQYVPKTDWGSSWRPGEDTRDSRPSMPSPKFREVSVEPKSASARHSVDERERQIYARQKRERSRSPVDKDSRAPRRLRTNSPSPVRSGRRSPSLVSSARRREEKQPERRSPATSRDTPPETVVRAPIPLNRAEHKPRTPPRPTIATTSQTINRNNITTPSQHFNTPKPVIIKRPEPSRQPSVATPAQPQPDRASVPSPTKRLEIPTSTPSGPRSASTQPSPARLPKIPEYNLDTINKRFESLEKMSDACFPLLSAYSRASVELRRAKADTDISAIELRSAEQRRIFAEQQRQRALET